MKKIVLALLVVAFMVSTAFAAVTVNNGQDLRQFAKNGKLTFGSDGGFGFEIGIDGFVVPKNVKLLWGSNIEQPEGTPIPEGEEVYAWIIDVSLEGFVPESEEDFHFLCFAGTKPKSSGKWLEANQYLIEQLAADWIVPDGFAVLHDSSEPRPKGYKIPEGATIAISQIIPTVKVEDYAQYGVVTPIGDLWQLLEVTTALKISDDVNAYENGKLLPTGTELKIDAVVDYVSIAAFKKFVPGKGEISELAAPETTPKSSGKWETFDQFIIEKVAGDWSVPDGFAVLHDSDSPRPVGYIVPQGAKIAIADVRQDKPAGNPTNPSNPNPGNGGGGSGGGGGCNGGFAPFALLLITPLFIRKTH